MAVVDMAGTTSTINYVHADDLGTPRAVTDSAGSTLWQWSYAGNPFGEQQPTSVSGYVFNLRFPGQYHDAESGLKSNRYRYFESARGGYSQSDPVGLGGGLNTYTYGYANPLGLRHSMSTYAYVDDNPLVAFDPDGKAKVLDPDTPVGGSSTIVCDGLGGISVYMSPQITFDEMACWGDCTRAHEMVHRQQFLKANPTICANQPAFMRMGERNKIQADADEIAAYKVQMECLEAKLRAINDCDKCKAMLQNELEERERLSKGLRARV
ncbi:RHS repeat domain-containing protein [Dyella tabacisoli]|uniref:RHS repeat-associated core domain-containing protein n=1 Tax=Dyella tabacisoli TaxID=2282381 RepID=A0A369UNU9_9GAMM|nr:RHS repeat-associated core domain-containing protein [Dyella tabacisoli]RDD82442.1 hypothetical protein DVJ77_05695 [Dyella tabacisoli]